MGKKGIEIVKKSGLKIDELVEKLNKAYSDEWLAYYQYWIGAKVAEGIFRDDVIGELIEHAGEELEHADKLAERIIQLGGTPVLDPKEWFKVSECGYYPPEDPDTRVLLKQNIASERCAIETYNEIVKMVEGKDPVTHHLMREILDKELEHEQDLEDLEKDISYVAPAKKEKDDAKKD